MRNVMNWSVVGLVLFGGAALAQQPGQSNVRPGVQPQPQQPQVRQQVPGQQPGQQQNAQQQQQSDQQIAALIAACNRNEVEVSRFALDKIKSSEVKEIATTMMKDHTAAAEKFGKLAGTAGAFHSGVPGGADRREDGPRDNERSEIKPGTINPAPNAPGTRPAAPGVATAPGNAAAPGNPATVTALKPAMGGQLNWSVIHQEIAAEGLASCKKELSRYEGDEFDKAFLGSQLAAHLKAATELKVLKRHASSQLAAEIDDALASTEEHTKHLREAMEEKKDK